MTATIAGGYMKQINLSKLCVGVLVMTVYSGVFSCSNPTEPKGDNSAVTFSRTFGGEKDDWSSSVLQTTDNGYVVIGSTLSYGTGGYDALLIKFDEFGELEWFKTFGEADNDWGHFLCETTDGGFMISARVTNNGIGPFLTLIKTNSVGVEQWRRSFDVRITDHSPPIHQTLDGGFMIFGITFLLKVDLRRQMEVTSLQEWRLREPKIQLIHIHQDGMKMDSS
jgi:hypothetical protein